MDGRPDQPPTVTRHPTKGWRRGHRHQDSIEDVRKTGNDQEGRPDHRCRPGQAGRRPAQEVREGPEHPRAGRGHRPLLRLRAPAAAGRRGAAARPGRRHPHQEEVTRGPDRTPIRTDRSAICSSRGHVVAAGRRAGRDGVAGPARPSATHSCPRPGRRWRTSGITLGEDVRVVDRLRRGSVVLRRSGSVRVRPGARIRCWPRSAGRRRPSPTRRSPASSAASAGCPTRGSSPSPRSPGTRSAPDSSWRWPAT